MGMDLLDFDACAEFWVETWGDWERFVSVSTSVPSAASRSADAGFIEP